MASIKNEIIGTWRLLSYIEVPVDGSDSFFPLGKSPKGILIFSPDDFMSVQISASEEANFKSPDRLNASNEEIQNRLRTYIAFTGKYSVVNETACVVYHIETSLYPNWEGTKQERKLDFEADFLYQKSVEPILSGGQYVYAYMTWRKYERENLEEVLIDEMTFHTARSI